MGAPSALLGQRHGLVRQALGDQGLDALVVTHLPNVFYLTSLAASAAVAVVTPANLYLVSDFRYSAAVDRLLASVEAPPETHFVPVEASYDSTLTDLLGALGPSRVGFEAARVPVRQHATWTARLAARSAPLELVATDNVIERLRMVKDGFEVGLLREAASRLSDVARTVLIELAAPGRSEQDLAADVDWRIKRAGFERPAFDTIVASGPNSALPHARPTDRRVEEGDLLLFDFGGVFRGYCVDLTRTVVVGQPTAEQRRVYRAVHAAQRAAIETVCDGAASDRVDAAARDLLSERELGDAFGHGTGHGLGLEVHEDPRLGKRRDEGPAPVVLGAGMVCTIEPGAYLPGFGGVRLEDDVLVTPTGRDILTDVPFDDRLL